jgi:2-polyprenyl-6-methoxyphenol hydroxylase-like FAD-dependent oxidoreductase
MKEQSRIAITGAGLGGLCLAQALSRSGFDVHVYERDASRDARRQGYRITANEQGAAALEYCLPPERSRRCERRHRHPAGPATFVSRTNNWAESSD